MMATSVKVASVSEIAPGTAKQVEANGQPIALFNVGGKFYALSNTCTHRGGPLAEGILEEITVECPWHGARFDVTTGAVEGPPARDAVKSYKVIVEGTDVKIEIS